MQKYVVKNILRPEKHLIDQISQSGVSTVYEAQGRIGLMNHQLKPILQGASICGPAVTAICYAGDNLMIHAVIEVCQPDDVLVVTTIGENCSGMIGELIVQALMKRGVKGLIIDSGVRDVARIREMGFPVWSKCIFSEGTTKSRGGWVNAPSICGGVEVMPGDIIMADDDGVVVVKQNDLTFVLESSIRRESKEEETKAKIARGELSIDFYGLRDVLKKEQVVYCETFDDMKNG